MLVIAKKVKPATISKGNGDVKTTVSTNENAIGFVSFEYLGDAISAININGIKPTAENVKAGSYVLSRPFLAVTNEQYVTEDAKNLIDYIIYIFSNILSMLSEVSFTYIHSLLGLCS